MAGFWQRSYYDHVIRNDADFTEKARYIENHPYKESASAWAEWHDVLNGMDRGPGYGSPALMVRGAL